MKEADRELLVNVLQPLGFEVRTAASGRRAGPLDHRLPARCRAAGLAMPGIDGWETLRRLRALGGAQWPVAIVSADTFDRVLDNGEALSHGIMCSSRFATTELLDSAGAQSSISGV
ncbi:MAG: hypothetical protein IPH54_22355 [Rhodoferax sp.]|nr:hypothetical protein [Rhodoferax sp.]